MRVALIHDYLNQWGGAEKVLQAFCEIWPEAPIFTLVYDEKVTRGFFKEKRICTSFLQKFPFLKNNHRLFLMFMPQAIESFNLSGYDLVLSDSASYAKGVITRPETLHISYCHTPLRYVWDDNQKYVNEFCFPEIIKKFSSFPRSWLRIWDKEAASRVDKFIANSISVKKRIAKYYRRGAVVIYPPVDLGLFSISKDLGDYFLIGGRLAPYKRVDIVIEAFLKLDYKLKIFGDGVDMKRLKKIAGDSKNIEFLGRIDDEAKARLYSRCRAFINPQYEDFGITAVEAMASGRPVIAYRRGGAVETIKENITGVFFDDQTPAGIMKAISDFEKISFNPEEIKQRTKQFSTERFKEEIKKYIDEEYKKFKK